MTDSFDAEEGLVRLCRAAIGDTLRCVVHASPESATVLYLRRDLDRRDARGRELERALALLDGASPSTDHVVVEGAVTAVVIPVADHEVWLTSDDPRGGDCGFEDVVPAVTALFAHDRVERRVPLSA